MHLQKSNSERLTIDLQGLTKVGLTSYGESYVWQIYLWNWYKHGLKPCLCCTGLKDWILAYLDCRLKSVVIIVLVCTVSEISTLSSQAFSHQLLCNMYQQVEARIVVLAVLRMFKENYHTHGINEPLINIFAWQRITWNFPAKSFQLTLHSVWHSQQFSYIFKHKICQVKSISKLRQGRN